MKTYAEFVIEAISLKPKISVPDVKTVARKGASLAGKKTGSLAKRLASKIVKKIGL
jgi:hypothetical protein